MDALPPGTPLVAHLLTVLRDPEAFPPGADGLRHIADDDDDALQRVMRGLTYALGTGGGGAATAMLTPSCDRTPPSFVSGVGGARGSARFLKPSTPAAAAPRPRDCAAIFVVLIGGTTFSEVRAAREAWRANDDPLPPVRGKGSLGAAAAARPPRLPEFGARRATACPRSQVTLVSNCLTGPSHMYAHIVGRPAD